MSDGIALRRAQGGRLTVLASHRGLEAVKQCQRVFLEAYTSILLCEKEKLVRCVRDMDASPSSSVPAYFHIAVAPDAWHPLLLPGGLLWQRGHGGRP